MQKNLNFAPKKLKASKLRILLNDGRELQYHVPKSPREPIDLRSFLAELNGRPLEVEIGPGKGEFLARRAAEFPDRFFIGIDRRLDRFRLTEKKLKRVEFEGRNWKLIREDARSFLEAGLPPIDVMHVYHPDPWPKARHHKHRFFRSPDAKRWAEALRPKGELRISTDHPGYFEEILDICQSWGFLRLETLFKKDALKGPAQSHFEQIFLKKSEPVYKALFRRP